MVLSVRLRCAKSKANGVVSEVSGAQREIGGDNGAE